MIKVNEKYKIDADNYTCILYKVGTTGKNSKNAGEEVLKVISYHPNIAGCLNKIIQSETKELISSKDYYSLNEFIEELKAIKNEYEDLISNNITKWEELKINKK